MNSLIRKQTGVFLLAAFLIAAQLAAPATALAAQTVPLAEAIDQGVRVSPDLAALRKELQQKEMEVVQARQAILTQAEKDGSSIAKQHSLTRDIDLSTKVPSVQLEVRTVMRNMDSTTRQTQMQVEGAYMTAYQTQLAADSAQKEQEQARKKLDQLRSKQRFGYATQDEVKAAEEALKEAESGYKTAMLAFKAARLALGGMIGRDLDGDYRFDLPRRYAILDEPTMWRLTSAALRGDVEVFRDTEARRLAEAKVNTIRHLYRSKFGAEDFAALDSLVQTAGETDMDDFMQAYNALADKIEARWSGSVWILASDFPFIKYVTRKSLQGEYDGIRYFEDKQNALPLAMIDLEKARNKEAETRKKTIEKVQKSFLQAKQAEEAYVQSMKAADAIRKQVQDAEKKQKFGYVTEEQMEQQRDSLDKAEQAVVATYMAYKTSLSQLNVDAAGNLRDQNGILPYDRVTNGYEPFTPPAAEADPHIGTWLLEPATDTLTSSFSVKLDAKLGATHYQLRSKTAKKPVGERVKIDQKVLHLSLVFSDLSDLELVVYKDKAELAAAELEGYAPSGTLNKRN